MVLKIHIDLQPYDSFCSGLMKQPFRQTKFKLVYLFQEKYCVLWRLRPYKISPLKEDSAWSLRGKKLITSKWSTTAKFCEDFSTLFLYRNYL